MNYAAIGDIHANIFALDGSIVISGVDITSLDSSSCKELCLWL